MSDYQWCHGPKCHTNHTQDRIRGVKGSKVLRTRKIAQNNWNANTQWSHFCSQGCWNDFMYAHWNEFIRHRRESGGYQKETFTHTDYFGKPYTSSSIKGLTTGPK